MKASELVKELQVMIELHGDCEVCVESYDYDFDYDSSYSVNSISFGYRYNAPQELKNTFYIQ